MVVTIWGFCGSQKEREEQQSDLGVRRMRPLGWPVVGLVSLLPQRGDVEEVFVSEEW